MLSRLLILVWAVVSNVVCQYVITLQRDEVASIYCYSSMERTRFFSRNRTCVEGMKVDDPDNVLYPPDRSCSTNVPFSDTPVQVTCQNWNGGLNISVLVQEEMRSKNKGPNSTISADLEVYQCLQPTPRRRLVTAGHLLSLSYSVSPRRRSQIYTVEVLATWDMTRGARFTCNNTLYSLAAVYKCLQFVPTGWPSFTNCTTLHKIGITIVVVVTFLSAYCVLCVGLSNLARMFCCRGKNVD